MCNRPIFLLCSLALLTSALARAEPLLITADQAVGPVRRDPGHGICATIIHVKDQNRAAFMNAADAYAQLNMSVGQGMLDGKISRIFKNASFRNSDGAVVGDFTDAMTEYLPYSNHPLAMPMGNNRNIAARVRGYVNVRREGIYSNGVQAYSGERLRIGGSTVTEYDQTVATRVVRQLRYASSGLYPVEVVYYGNGSEGYILELSVAQGAEPEGARFMSLDTSKFHLLPTTQLYSARAGAAPGCVECSDDAVCGKGNYCVHDWKGGGPGPDGVCQPCMLDNHCGDSCMACAGGKPICDQNACVECVYDADCPVGKVCDPATHSCAPGLPCTRDAECPPGKVCDPDAKICVGKPVPCKDDVDCPLRQVCDPDKLICVKPPTPCTSDNQCKNGYVCDTAKGLCKPKSGVTPRYVGGDYGCNAGGHGGAAGLAGLLLFGAALLLGRPRRLRARARRRGGLLPLVFLLLIPLDARAQQTLSANTQTFQPAIGPENIYTAEGSRTPGRLKPMFQGFLEYAHRPLRLVNPATNEVLVNTVSSVTTLHLMGGLGLTRWLAVGVDLPLVLYEGYNCTSPDPSIPTCGKPSAFGVGDLRLVGKLRIIDNTESGIGLAFVPLFTFPTGEGGDLRGDVGVGIEPRFALDYRFRGGSIVALNLGFLGRTHDQTVGDMLVSSEVRYALGGLFALPKGFAILGELWGGTSVKGVQNGPSSIYSPFEGDLGGRWVHASGWSVDLGLGTGFTAAVGSPQVRLFASVGYLPMDRAAKPAGESGMVEVNKIGSGVGAVRSMPPGLDCGTVCKGDYPRGTEVTLTASPGPDSHFVGWSGPCSGTEPCVVRVQDATSVGVEFARNLEPRALFSIDKVGDGTGTVTSEPAGVDCGKNCTATFRVGQEVKLTARPNEGSWFGGWEGPCTGMEVCTAVVGGPTTVRAKFNEKKVEITPEKIDLKGNVIHFETGKATIEQDSHILLDEIAGLLLQYRNIRLRIEGHTDSRPFKGKGGNLHLSRDRAKAVVEYLVAHGIDGERLSSEGYGDACPVDTNKTEEGRAKNRRTEFWIDNPTAQASRKCRARQSPVQQQ